MNKLIIVSTIATMIFGSAYLQADDDYDKRGNARQYDKPNSVMLTSSNPQQKLYVNECGSCHMAYQPEFLPQRSWKKMMSGLEDHFGVDATVEAEDNKTLSAYLRDNASDSKRADRHFQKMAASIGANDSPLRISETPYFKREHREIPKKYINQKEVKSIANCVACHQAAQQGDYRERGILIPNYGSWDD